MAVFEGAGVAIVTPFFEDGTVNYNRLTELLEEQIAAGTDSIIICGTTGEASTLSHEEHLAPTVLRRQSIFPWRQKSWGQTHFCR